MVVQTFKLGRGVAKVAKNKYLYSKTLVQVEAQPTNFPFWKGLMRVKDDFFNRGSFKIGNRETPRFWEDT